MPEVMVRFDDLRRYCEKRHCGSVPLEYIKQMRTVEAKPVRHGRWHTSLDKFCYICSECQMMYRDNPKYCPRCGAEMNGGDAGCR